MYITVLEMSEIYPFSKLFREINLQYNSLVKKVTLTKFLRKNRGGKIFKLPNCVVLKNEKFSHQKNNSSNQLFLAVLPDSAIYRQFRDFEGYVGDEFFAKIACDFSVKFRDFKELAIFGNFSAISGQNSAIFAIFEPHL